MGIYNFNFFFTGPINTLLDGYLKVRESIYILVIIWVNSNILYYVGTKANIFFFPWLFCHSLVL